jgi:hypothetical protein
MLWRKRKRNRRTRGRKGRDTAVPRSRRPHPLVKVAMTKTILPFLLGAVMPLLVVGWLLVRH